MGLELVFKPSKLNAFPIIVHSSIMANTIGRLEMNMNAINKFKVVCVKQRILLILCFFFFFFFFFVSSL
jgi:hypothetical protein